MATTDQNKQTVERVFEGLRAGRLDIADELVRDDYIQHNPMGPNGRAAVKAAFALLGPQDLVTYRLIAEGDLVVAHSHNRTRNVALVDIFRFDEEGRIAEHWDVAQPVPETTVSGNDMFSRVG